MNMSFIKLLAGMDVNVDMNILFYYTCTTDIFLAGMWWQVLSPATYSGPGVAGFTTLYQSLGYRFYRP